MAVSRMNSEVGRVLGRRYRIVAPIGMGASAQVFLADDARLRRRVAVKMLHEALADDADFLRRFRAEARAAAALSHPNVVAVFDWGDEDVPFIVTEFLAGGSLRAMLDAGAVLTPAQALLVGLETARALDFAHRRGLVHRDIKPANLLFGDEGRLRVADFGLARALAEAAWTEPQGAVLGTARYASPEQATGHPLDGKADVYSLALLLIEAVTGQVPFAADTTLGTLMARVDRPLVVPEALGPLRRVLELAGRPDPADRIDARTMAGGLLAAARELGRPEPLVLAGALPRDGFVVVDDDPTLHGPVVDGADGTHGAAAGASDVVDLRDDDLDLDPPDWVSSAEPRASASAPALDPLPDPIAELDGDLVIDLTDGAGQNGNGLPDLRWRSTASSELDTADAGPDRPGGDASDRGEPGTRRPATANELADAPPVEPLPRPAPGAGATAPMSQHDVLRPLADPAPQPSGATAAVAADERPAGRRRRWPWAVLAFLLVSAAATVAVLLLTDRPADRTPAIPTFQVPDLAGRTEASARQAVTRYRWKVTTSHSRRDATMPGQVLRTDPPAGKRVRQGGRLRLVISDGNTLSTIPTGLGGQPTRNVQALLLKLGLVAKLSPRYDEKVPNDVVIGVVGGTPARLPKGQQVPIVVSAGPEPRLVPAGLVGATEADARARVAAVQLTAVIRRDFSDTVAAGRVISSVPAGGTSVPRGSPVKIVVSKGPDLVTVPSLSGATTIDGAIARLRTAGLTAGNVSGPATGRPRSTRPAAGQRVKRGTTVDIVLA